MPKKKDYKPRTYGMQPKEYMKLFDEQIKKVKECEHYNDFLEDAKILKETQGKQNGKPSLLTGIWIKRICDMDDKQLFKYVNNYKKGELDPYQFEPGHIKDEDFDFLE